ncbi:MAG TPA: CPBP family intramembrane glutamic endopeptidase [Bacillota bacterium]|nr:CPBP family intramembrane glutamic endopeptidase [Bacillota bacterium]
MSDSKQQKTIWEIVIFTFLVIGLAFLGPLLGGSPSKPGPGFILWGIAPMLVAVLMRIITKDWSDAGVKLALRKNAIWYAVSILSFPIMTVFTLLIGQIISVSSFSGFEAAPYLKTFLTALPVFFIFAIFEEFGWRGYLVPKLALLGFNNYLKYAIVAVVWASWHLPYFRELSWVYSSEDLLTFIPRFYLSMFAFTILYNEIRVITGSVWPAVFMHCVMNSFGHPLIAEYLKIMPGKDYLVSSTGFFMIVFTGLLGIALNRWRMRTARVHHLNGKVEKSFVNE